MNRVLIVLSLLFSFSVYASEKDPSKVAKAASWNLLKEYLFSVKSPKLIKTEVVEKRENFFLTHVVVDADEQYGGKRTKQDFCLVLQVDMNQDKTFDVSYIENNNDKKNIYIQRCSSDLSQYDLNKFKFLNNWPKE